ncbi:MAG: adenylate/guanylate cyclase domain-containing protein [Acholeplasmatales bacterium]|nr:adenylate/guanylate cyclase domain-containing protein [Acholeplasmatales bacterium]
MKKIFKFHYKNLIFSGIFTILTLLFCIISNAYNPFESLDNNMTDSIYQKEGTPDKRITIVGIDEDTIEKYNSYNAYEYRGYFTDVLNKWDTLGCHPKAIGFDIIFNNQYGCDDVDLEFGNALKKHNVILGVNGMSRSEAPYGLSSNIYNGAKGIGYVDAVTDKDEAIRKTYLKGKEYDSLAYSLYEMYFDNPKDYKSFKKYYFNYYAKPEINYTSDGNINSVMSGFNYISLKDLIENDIKIKDDSIVIFGAYCSALDTGLSNDIYNSPIGEMFGVEVQCNIIQSLLNNKIYTESSDLKVAFIDIILVFIVTFLMASFVFYIGAIVFALGIGSLFLIMMINHNLMEYYYISIPLFILIVSFIALIVMHYYNEFRRKKEVIGTFKRYISPDVCNALVDKDKEALALGGRKRNVACLFVDIRGFTKMSEELKPEEVVDVLNGYLDMATKQIFKYGGMVDKFIGDCVMAIFNAPLDLDDYIFKAVCAAYGIIKQGKEISNYVEEKYNKKLEFGVGVHFGDAVIGNIGSKTRMDFTAIGDTVNTASRIEASALGNQVLISSDVYEILKDRIEVIDAGERNFKNKKEAIKCYEVTNIIGYESDFKLVEKEDIKEKTE